MEHGRNEVHEEEKSGSLQWILLRKYLTPQVAGDL
jgi:hypothetical protein